MPFLASTFGRPFKCSPPQKVHQAAEPFPKVSAGSLKGCLTRNNRKGGTASLRSRTCVKRNVAFGARFKGLSLYFLYQNWKLIRIKTGLDTCLIRIQTGTPLSRYPPYDYSNLPKGPSRIKNTTTIEKVVNYYAVVFLLRPPYLLCREPSFERKNVCNSQENGVCTRCVAIVNHSAIANSLRVVNLLRIVFLVREGPLGSGSAVESLVK